MLGVVGACAFAPTTSGSNDQPSDAANMGSGSGSGSGMGSGSGSGSGSGMTCGGSDGDGVCDDVDDWPCGAKPNAPGNFNVTTFQYTLKDSNVELADQSKTLLVVHPGDQFSVKYDYQVTVPCGTFQTCHVQLELGTDAGKQGCGDSVDVQGVQLGPLQLGTGSGTSNLNLSLANAGVYKILTQPNEASSCGGNSWVGGTPDDHLTVGIVCVHP